MLFNGAFTLLAGASLIASPHLVLAVRGTAQLTAGNLSGGTCMFSNYSLPPGIYGSALAGPNWDSGSFCGTCLDVTGERGTVTVMVVDQCPACKENQVLLFTEAFPKVGDPTKGTINVNWEIVSCNIRSPIVLRNKTGSSKYWFEMQVLNCNQAVVALEVSTDNGKTWEGTERQPYNYYKKAGGGGFGTDTVSVRITCLDGKKVVAAQVGVKGDTQFSTPINC